MTKVGTFAFVISKINETYQNTENCSQFSQMNIDESDEIFELSDEEEDNN